MHLDTYLGQKIQEKATSLSLFPTLHVLSTLPISRSCWTWPRDCWDDVPHPGPCGPRRKGVSNKCLRLQRQSLTPKQHQPKECLPRIRALSLSAWLHSSGGYGDGIYSGTVTANVCSLRTCPPLSYWAQEGERRNRTSSSLTLGSAATCCVCGEAAVTGY